VRIWPLRWVVRVTSPLPSNIEEDAISEVVDVGS